MSTPIRVFVSYSHDSDAHSARVLALADALRTGGIDVRLDQYVVHPSEGWPQWTQKQLVDADFVLVVCTPAYRRRFEARETEGVEHDASWEAMIAAQLLYEAGSRSHKLLPVLFEEGAEQDVPLALRPFARYRLPSGYEELYRRITAQPKTPALPLGQVQVLPVAARPSLRDTASAADRRDTPLAVATAPELDGLRHALAAREVVAVVGPGVPMAGGLPSWPRLAAEARERAAAMGVAERDLREIDESIASGELEDAFTELAARLGGAELTRLVAARLDDRHGPGGRPIEIPNVAQALAELAPWLRAVITVSLDAFLERAFPRDWEVFERPVGDLAWRRGYLVHLYGVVRNRKTWVLTRSEHDRMAADPGYAAYSSAMARSSTLMFVGFELRDPSFARMVEGIRGLVDEQPVQHFALVDGARIGGARRRKLGEAGISVIGYEGQTELVAMLRGLVTADG